MTPAKLSQIVESLGGKYIASVRIETLSSEKFEFMALMSGAVIVEKVLMDDGGPVVMRSFTRLIDGAAVEVCYRRAANLAELRESL